MAVGEQETRCTVVEFCSQPAVKRMAAYAIRCREGGSCLAMNRIRGFLIIREVAGRTFRGQTLELADSRTLVTIFTLHSGVRTEEREAVLVVFQLLHGNIPALHRMALRAVRAHFSLMHVGVAVLAILSDVRENWLDVALRALHLLVHAPQGISCLVVVKLRHRADGAPGCGCVTIFTRDCEGAVRASGALPLGRRCRRVGRLPRKEQEPAQNLNNCVRNCPSNNRLPTIYLRWLGCSETTFGCEFGSVIGPKQLYRRPVLEQPLWPCIGWTYSLRNPGLQGFDVPAMAIHTLRRHLFVDNHRLPIDQARMRLQVTFVTGDIGMASLQWKMRPGIVVKGRGDPAPRIVTIRACCLS